MSNPEPRHPQDISAQLEAQTREWSAATPSSPAETPIDKLWVLKQLLGTFKKCTRTDGQRGLLMTEQSPESLAAWRAIEDHYRAAAAPSSPETTWKELATAYTKIGSIEECAHWKALAHAYAPAVTGPISQSGSRSGSASDATPTASSPETPAELTEALRKLPRLAQRLTGHDHIRLLTHDEIVKRTEAYNAAEAEVVSLYTRQREDVEFQTLRADTHLKTINSLSSQLERLTADFAQAEESRATNSALYERAMADVERLKASQLTPEETKAILNDLKFAGYTMEGNPRYAALRLRSLSDQKND